MINLHENEVVLHLQRYSQELLCSFKWHLNVMCVVNASFLHAISYGDVHLIFIYKIVAHSINIQRTKSLIVLTMINHSLMHINPCFVLIFDLCT